MNTSCAAVSSSNTRQIVTVEQDGKSIYCHRIRDEYILPSSKTTIPRLTIETQSSGHSGTPAITQNQKNNSCCNNMSDPWYSQMVNPTFSYLEENDACHYPKPEGMCTVSTGPVTTHMAYADSCEQKPTLLSPHSFPGHPQNHSNMWSPSNSMVMQPRTGYVRDSAPSPSPFFPQPTTHGLNMSSSAHNLGPYSQPGTPYSFADSPTSSFEGSMGNVAAPPMAYQHSTMCTGSHIQAPGMVDGMGGRKWGDQSGNGMTISPQKIRLIPTPSPPLSMGSTGGSLSSLHNESSPLPIHMEQAPNMYHEADNEYHMGAAMRPRRYLPAQPPLVSTQPSSSSLHYLQASNPSIRTSTSRDCRVSKESKTVRQQKDDFLVRAKMSGMTYRDIRKMGMFTEAESTLRGRFRTLTKRKEARVRKPEWCDMDEHLLKKAVRHYSDARAISLGKIPWKKVAEYIFNEGGSYHFGNATCRKKWDQLVEQGREH